MLFHLLVAVSKTYPAGLSFWLMPHPNQRPSVLSILSLSLEMLINMFTIVRHVCTACSFFKKIVVLSTIVQSVYILCHLLP